ncbi:TonB-dependent receptor-like protein [Sphingobium sp. SYK-6]|uniref:TonB-dependent receptor plug domain-containing protein n=1 Tax=Sphingobium sp. (strain NBRC 103272 / SYK-6) TaxID=627192 RepID=UPI0002277638|nr:TonB-dependent receptor [Sphingobium sp. SYK-6]BAK67856.1 TonB-dependent receptor-like protein [Sphingobium sp. SYK-6]
MQHRYRSNSVRAPLFVGSALYLLALAPAGALAQDTVTPQAAAAPEDQAIVITGSRIARRDYSSDTPIVTLSADALNRSSEVSFDQSLNKLPQFGTGANQITSATDIQSTPTSSPGIATVNLRGLGSNRTLVLVNGRRTQPANASLVVDLNTIPAAAVDNVEIITGGAGATYGADAVAGVVNFILKRNFQGVQIDGQAGQTFRGDGEQYKVSTLLGSNFADDRGNAMIGLTYQKRTQVYLRDRPFFEAAFTDPNTPGRNAWPNFGGYLPTNGTQAAYDTVFGAKGFVPGDVPNTAQLYFNTAPTTAGATLFTVSPGVRSGTRAPGFTGSLYPDNKFLNNGLLSPNSYTGFLSSPLERYSLFAAAHYEVSDNLTFYTQASFDQNDTTTEVIGYSPAFNQWSVTIPYDAAHPVPTELATILNSRANPNAPWTLYKQMDYLGPRQISTTTYTYEVLFGARGDLGVRDWTYDIFMSHGRTSQNTNYRGFADLARYQELINRPNYGAGADYNNGRTGMLAHCTSGLNPFVNTPVSQDCIDIISAPINTETILAQDQVELNLQGSLAEIPAGDLRFALGAAYRKNDFEYRPDPAFSTTNTTSLTIGLFDTSPTKGDVNVKEIYGEVLVPILRDLPFVRSLTLNAGARYSDYSTTGGVFTWKTTLDWDVNPWLKLRGGYQQANRAPNVAELYQPPVFQTVPWPDHDPCSMFTRATYGNVASNPDRAKVQALCSALSGGVPIGDNFVGNVPSYFALGRDLQRGNANLDNEKAKTWTLGAVVNSPFDAEALRALRLSVDYYHITIDGAIAPASTQLVYQECFNSLGNNPNYDPNNEYCQRISRNTTNGQWIATTASFENLGLIQTSGIDVQFDWSLPAPGIGETGAVFANIVYNYLINYKVQNNPGGPVFDYANSIGSTIFVPPYGAQFRWKLNTTLGYDFGLGTVSMNWRHFPRARHAARVTNSTATQTRTSAYDIFDLSAQFRLNDMFQIRGGIDNLFDRDPNIIGAIPGTTAAVGEPDPAGTYDVLGRRFYVGVRVDF